jgi:hypothetical protein
MATEIRTGDPTRKVSVQVFDGPTKVGSVDDYELFFARRALGLIKKRLGLQRILKLLAADIAEGDEFLRNLLAESNSEWIPAATELRVDGLDWAHFGNWMKDHSITKPPSSPCILSTSS